MNTIEEQRRAVREGVLVQPAPELGTLVVTGTERKTWLNGMITCDVVKLDTGSGAYALAVAKGAVERGFDDGMTSERRGFLYMPFQHSEDLADQRRSLLLFTALGDAEQLKYARLHHDVIKRFGRFPHRNRMLGRKPTALEEAAGEVVPW